MIQERKFPNREKDQIYSYHDQFYNDPNFVNFSKNANIPEETIDTETKSIEEVIDTIFSKIESLI